MSQAARARSAAERANIAIRMLRTVRNLGRAFDDCFEMNDGDAVVHHIRRRAAEDQSLRELLEHRGFGRWLAPDYFERYEGRTSLPPDDANEPFQLRNEPPKPKAEQFESMKGRQSVLFAGLDCLPGQCDLFPTDGKESDEQSN